MVTQYQTELVIGGDSSNATSAIKETILFLDSLGRTYKKVSDGGVASANSTKAAYDKLRKSFDTIYSVSKRYESAVDTLNAAHKSGILTDQQLEVQLEATARAYGFLEARVESYGAAAKVSRFHTANVAAQLNDIFVMVQAGQSPMMTAIQQGTQLGQVWTNLGSRAAVFAALKGGFLALLNPMTLATVAFIGVTSAATQFFMSLGESEEELSGFDKMVEDLAGSIQELADKLELAASGYETLAEKRVADKVQELTDKIWELNEASQESMDSIVSSARVMELQAELDKYKEMLAKKKELTAEDKAAAANKAEYDRMEKQRLDEFASKAKAEAAEILRRGQQARDALGDAWLNWNRYAAQANAQLEIAFGKFSQTAAVSLELQEEIGAAYASGALLANLDIASGIYSAAQAAQALASELGVSLSTAQKLIDLQGMTSDQRYSWAQGVAGNAARNQGPAGGNDRPGGPDRVLQDVPLGPVAKDKARGGGGGGSKEDPLVAQLEKLQEYFMTEIELEKNALEQKQAMLEEALEKKLLTMEEYNKLMEQLQADHQEKMSAIDAYRYGTASDKLEAFLGDAASILANGNEKMLKVSKIFAAAQAWIDTLQGAARELRKGTFGFASAAAVLAKGAALVSAIKSTGKGTQAAVGSGAVTASQSVTEARPQLSLTLIGDNFGRGSIYQLVDAFNKASTDGAVIRGTK